MSAPTSISITIHTDHVLTVGEVWPDADSPNEVITADHVLTVLAGGRGVRANLRDWQLLEDLDVTIHVSAPNPAHGGDPLPGMPDTPERIETTTQVTT